MGCAFQYIISEDDLGLHGVQCNKHILADCGTVVSHSIYEFQLSYHWRKYCRSE